MNKHALGSDAVAPFDRPEWIAESELGALVDVGRHADAALRDVATDIDEHGDGALRHKAGAVVDDDDRLAVAAERGRAQPRGIFGSVPGVTMSVRGPLRPNSTSTATVRAASSLRSATAVVRS